MNSRGSGGEGRGRVGVPPKKPGRKKQQDGQSTTLSIEDFREKEGGISKGGNGTPSRAKRVPTAKKKKGKGGWYRSRTIFLKGESL